MPRSALTAVVLVALVVSGCSVQRGDHGDPAAAALSSLPAVPAGAVEEVPTNVRAPVDPPAVGMRVRDFDGEADLRGPHFTIAVDWVATGRAIEELSLPMVPALDARRAPDGAELFIVAVDGESGGQGQWNVPDGESAPPVELVVDGKATPLTTVPVPAQDAVAPIPQSGVLVVASVPVKAPVTLRVTDAERTQTVDLRAGKRGKDAIPGYYQPYSQEISFDTSLPAHFTAGGGSYPTTLQVTSRGGTDIAAPYVLLAPWTPSGGWAADGRAWLVVPQPVVETPIVSGVPGLRYAVTEPEVFKVQLPDGTEIAETGGTREISTPLGHISGGGDDLVFDVPATFVTGTFRMLLASAPAVAMFSDGDYPARFSAPPPPFELAIDLAA